ncbi:stonustoxin subunit alpha [Oryzias melastigma]|uniref:stonustoxin subunit alpha n=1 Tax=Oryzias melastigma TaxID=30732 RepID=UPI000CF806EE|nr:stonustoxin subunit alpha [Oryzias melastigma]
MAENNFEDTKAERQTMVETIKRSAVIIINESQNVFNNLHRLLEQKCSEVEQKVKSMEKERKEEEMEEQIKKLDQLSMEDQPSSSEDLSVFKDSASFQQAQHCLDDALKVVSEATEKLETVRDQITKISRTLDNALLLRSREDFMKYYRHITLDKNTANEYLSLSDENRTVTWTQADKNNDYHPDRFLKVSQVLSAEGLTGRCYWEVEWSGDVYVAVAYKGISRKGTQKESGFGHNDKSWALRCSSIGYEFFDINNKDGKPIENMFPDPQSSRVGVYLNHTAGTLSFYRVSDSMTLIHKVQTTFTQPLYAGFRLPSNKKGKIRLLDKN